MRTRKCQPNNPGVMNGEYRNALPLGYRGWGSSEKPYLILDITQSKRKPTSLGCPINTLDCRCQYLMLSIELYVMLLKVRESLLHLGVL